MTFFFCFYFFFSKNYPQTVLFSPSRPALMTFCPVPVFQEKEANGGTPVAGMSPFAKMFLAALGRSPSSMAVAL